MMVHCTVVQPFICIVDIIELQSSERAEAQGSRSWVELWAAGRGGCCCMLPPQPGRASRSIWAVDARAEVLEVGTHDGQSGVMLAGVEIAHIQPAHAHLVGVVGWSWGPAPGS